MESGDFFKLLADKELMARCKNVDDVFNAAVERGFTDSWQDFSDSVGEMMKAVDPNWDPNKDGFTGQRVER